MQRKIIIGSRGSDLALWQANHVQSQLKDLGHQSEIKIISTQGDRIQHLSFDKLEGKGFFTKEIEESLLNKSIDVAVHSHKDLETEQPEGLCIAAVSPREEPNDILLIRKEKVDTTQKFDLKKGATVGTSSARRKSQILFFRPDVSTQELRGNVPTRIQKLANKQYDAILLAYAGVKRLGLNLDEFHLVKLPKKEFIPAPAQGVLGLQIREKDGDLKEILNKINDEGTATEINIERKILNLFQGGCQLPLGAFCKKNENEYQLWVSVAKTWDASPKRLFLTAESTDGLAELAVKKLKNFTSKSIFISREIKADSFFNKTLKNANYNLESRSLIELKPIVFNTTLPPSDWIFFSSKNSVKHFFNAAPKLEGQKLATIGLATANQLIKYGKKADFIGCSNDAKEIALEFSNQLQENEKILFPQSGKSLQTVQKKLATQQVINLVTYQTLFKDNVKATNADILIFTSPSNVASYIKNNEIKAAQSVIAIGKTTQQYLIDNNIENPILAWNSSELALLDAVFSI